MDSELNGIVGAIGATVPGRVLGAFAIDLEAVVVEVGAGAGAADVLGEALIFTHN